MKVLVAYDIAENKRIYRVAKVLKNHGRRAQNSVFVVEVKSTDLDKLRKRIEAIIEPETDTVKYFPMCLDCRALVWRFGLNAPEEDSVDHLTI